MGDAARMKYVYDAETAVSYPATGPSRPGYEAYMSALREGMTAVRNPRVLDLGCGTGRYFHCLESASLLVGLDASGSMLDVAARALDDIPSLKNTEVLLVHGDILSIDFAPASYDFIYSIGVLGEYVPASGHLVAAICRWLSPSGSAFFTVVDAAEDRRTHRQYSQVLNRMGLWLTGTRVVGWLPRPARRWWLDRLDYSYYHLSQPQIAQMLAVLPHDRTWRLTRIRDAKTLKIACTIEPSNRAREVPV